MLAHEGARAFITHAGSHGLFEGLCHGVPMVMVPISGDQPDNAERLASRGAGVVLSLFSITTESLLQGLNEVMNNSRWGVRRSRTTWLSVLKCCILKLFCLSRYRENVQKLSALHKDRPAEPLDLSVYWTEYVMRHKGAKHLKSAVHDLNWIQYYCLDVIALLASVVLGFVILTVKCIQLCFRKLGRKRKQD